MSDSTVLTPQSASGFASLGLDPRLVESLTAHGYADPTPIQREAIPPLLAGRDLIGLAATGTGKTAAFALPLLQRLGATDPADRKRPSVLILVPTRELCIQVSGAVARYGLPVKVFPLAVYGGAGFGDQVRELKRGVDVIVATPGRALDHLRRGTLSLAVVSAVVLDEADEMLDMGFADDLEAILSSVPADRQTMLFSATMPPRIAGIAAKYLKAPVRIEVARPAQPVGEPPKVRHTAFLAFREQKTATLARVLDYEAPTSALIFCRTRDEADQVADALAARGYRPDSLHGGMSQEQRDRVMRKFRDGTTHLLVATDVAARGLDISHLSHVVNYGVPQAAEVYVHRVGRVGRAGREGVALTVCDPRERGRLRDCERAVGRRIEVAPIPTRADLRAKRLDRTRDALRELIQAGKLDEFKAVVGPLTTEFDPTAVALAAVALAAKAGRTADDDVEIPSPPVRSPVLRPGLAGVGPAPGPRPHRPPFGADRGPRTFPRPFQPARQAPGMTRLFVGVGRDAGVTRRDIVDVLGHEVGLGPRDIGNISVAERFSLVEVPGDAADHVIDTLQGVRIRGRQAAVRRDRG